MVQFDSPQPLPASASPLLGRERDLSITRELLLDPAVRLLTVTGPPGVGKTRLATALAAELGERFADGVRYVDLSPVPESRLVLPMLASVLGGAAAAVEVDHQPFAFPAGMDVLVVLDNFEHLLDSAPEFAAVLSQCQGLKLLVTSRIPFRISWEHQYQLTPLALPAALPGGLSDWKASPAVALFLQRAKAVAPGVALGDSDMEHVVEICQRLEGLPLAIELAAARVKVFPVASLAVGFERRLDLLGRGAADFPERHLSLRAAIGWSYGLLDSPLQATFRKLSVFAGGFGLDAMRDVCGPAGPTIVDHLERLVDSSLVQPAANSSPLPRFRLLETVREYARECLVAAAEVGEVAERHAAHFVALAESAGPALCGPGQTAWLERLDTEYPNLQAALRHLLENGETAPAARLAHGMWRYWWRRGNLADARSRVDELLAHPNLSGSADSRATALLVAGILAVWHSDYQEADEALSEASALAETLGASELLGYALTFRGRISRDLGRADAPGLLRRAVACQRERDDRWGLALALHFLGLALLATGTAEARAAFHESADIFRALGVPGDLAMPLRGLGITAFLSDDLDAARENFETSVSHFLDQSDEWSVAMVSQDLGYVAYLQGRLDEARDRFGESLRNWRRLGNRRGQIGCLTGLAGVAASGGKAREGATLLGAADALTRAEGVTLEPTLRASRDRIEEIARARANLGYDSSHALGTALGLQDALDLALEIADTRRAAETGSPPAKQPDSLSRRELEVAALLRKGFTNRQIGSELFISEGTAGLHVKHILAKLGFTSRAQIAAWAAERSLGTPAQPEP